MSPNVVIPDHEIPLWMRQAQRGIDWGMLLIILCGLLVSSPLLVNDQLSETKQYEHDAFLMQDYVDAMREGILYPRWSPHVADAYGAPIGNFIPPGIPYSGAIITLLFTNNVIITIRGMFIIGFILAGSMMYVVATQRLNARAGFIVALLYITNPYIAYTVPHNLGDLHTMAIIILAPSLLWSVNRYILRNHPLDFMIIVVTVATICFTIPQHLPVLIVLAGLILLADYWQFKRTLDIRGILLGFVCGVGLSSFYWLPAIAEQASLIWQNNLWQQEAMQISWAELLRPYPTIITSNHIASPQFAIGWISILLSIAGIVSAIWRKSSPFIIIFGVTGWVIIGVMINFFANQTGLLVYGVLGLVISTSSTLTVLSKPAHQQWFFVLLTVIIFIFHVPYIRPTAIVFPLQDVSPTQQITYEQKGFGFAPLPHGYILPTAMMPLVNVTIISEQYNLTTFDRIITQNINTQVTFLANYTHGSHYVINTTDALTLEYRQAYFIGWQATINGVTIPVSRHPENGHIVIEIPNNQSGELNIFFGNTPIRLMSWILSGLFLLVASITTIRTWRKSLANPDESQHLNNDESWHVFASLLLATLVISVPELQAIPPQITVSDPLTLPRTVIIRQQIAPSLTLVAYRLDRTSLMQNEDLDITLFWSATTNRQAEYLVRVRIGSTEPNLSHRYFYPAYVPTRRWHETTIASNTILLGIPPELVNGNYPIYIDVIVCDAVCDALTPMESTRTLTLPEVIQIN